MHYRKRALFLFFSLLFFSITKSQGVIQWEPDGKSYTKIEFGEIVRYTMPENVKTVLASKKMLTPNDAQQPLPVANYTFSGEGYQVLIFTNTKKVWRFNTRGDYWLLDIRSGSLKQLGKSRPASSLMFAKLSPDGKNVAYVSEYNLYVENIQTGISKPLTTGGHRKLINGTFDWAYEEEFFCRDGFRWSPDGKQIAYWQIDARKVKDHYMINNTKGVYPEVVPVEYPVAGELPSPAKIGVVNISTGKTTWMNTPVDEKWGSYLPRMEWAASNNELIVQHLNRKQNETAILICNAATGAAKSIYEEKDPAWIDIMGIWDEDYQKGGWDFFENGKEFLWASEKDGWRHLYRISRDGKTEKLITKGNYDVIDIATIDGKNNYIYFFASPENATQKYLYRVKADGSAAAEKLSPANQPGWHNYNISPTGAYAYHSFTNHYTPNTHEWVSLPDHKAVGTDKVNQAITAAGKTKVNAEFFTIKTAEGIEMDAWMSKPANFDPAKKYPVVFFVYTEPWGQEVQDKYGIVNNFLYAGDMAADGYFYIAIDNRGTPVPKGREWRKSVYQKIGRLNISDQASAAKEILKWPYIDTARVAVWGWSGGAAATLNLLFQYPEIYKTGMAVSAVGNQLTYDNIYQERYTGLPQESPEVYHLNSPITYAKNLRGNLLYVHGTGDDNVHYNNAEMLVNELVKYNKQFQFMAYPNRTHSVSEGEGTSLHLSTLYTRFLQRYCPPGGK